MRGLLVTGTDTGVGKTIVSAALIAAMSAAGEDVRAYKPAVTGVEDPPPDPWPLDHELLGAMAGIAADEVAPLRFGAAVSPHLAAALEGRRIEPEAILRAARRNGTGGVLVAEGVGGLLVPLTHEHLVIDFAVALGLPVVIAARAGLGTINHTLLTVRTARAAGLRVAAVVMTPWPRRPDAIERDNRETVARLGQVEVHGLPPLAGPDRAELAEAGGLLPWRSWLRAPAPVARGAAPA